MPTILHADWSKRPRTTFRRWTQAVHQIAGVQVGRHRFLACPYRFLAAKRQAKAEIFPLAIRTTELPSNPSPLSTRDGAQLTFRNNQIQISPPRAPRPPRICLFFLGFFGGEYPCVQISRRPQPPQADRQNSCWLSRVLEALIWLYYGWICSREMH